jgi:hypothetical protein
MQWKAYRGVTAIRGIAASGSQRVLFNIEWLKDLGVMPRPVVQLLWPCSAHAKEVGRPDPRRRRELWSSQGA